MKSLLRKVLVRGLSLLNAHQLERLWVDVAYRRALALPPYEGIRFLLRLDSELYAREGQAAIRYGNGEHPKHRLTRYHDFFVARVQPGEHVLDIGCGMGAVARDVAERSRAVVVGMDLDAESIATARSRYAHPRVEYRVGNALADLPGERFDVVILSNILEHLPERPAFLQRVVQAVQPSRLLIRVPLFERDWRVPLKRELGVEWRLHSGHETEYTLESFAEELTTAGLRITHQQVRWGEIWAEVIPAQSKISLV